MTTPTPTGPLAGAYSPPPTPAGCWPLPPEGVITGSHPQRGKTELGAA